jgi:hypothetical protein
VPRAQSGLGKADNLYLSKRRKGERESDRKRESERERERERERGLLAGEGIRLSHAPFVTRLHLPTTGAFHPSHDLIIDNTIPKK